VTSAPAAIHGCDIDSVIGDRWGVTADEVARAFPCDDWITSPTMEAWRGVTVNAAADHVWRWVTQVRLAPYSYDWIDNLGRRSPRELRSLSEPEVGEHFTSAAGVEVGRVLSVEVPHQLTGRIAGTVISYVIEALSDEQTRLLMKLVTDQPRPLAALLVLGDWVMARRQLLNFKHLAEVVPANPVP
jgi:hypothetical protein